jgi:hypothetical protein
VKGLLLGLCLLAASCAPPYTALVDGSSGLDGGVIRIAHPATYGYSLQTDDCGGGTFQLASPKGVTQVLIPVPESAGIYLSSGTWTATYAPDVSKDGTAASGCLWRISLWTPISS